MRIQMKAKQDMGKKERGVTLIALVITIIVLLVLAAAAIATLTGDNGIFSNAQNARAENKRAEVKEKYLLAYNTVRTQILSESTVNGGYHSNSEESSKKLAELVLQDITGQKKTVTDSFTNQEYKANSGTYTVTFSKGDGTGESTIVIKYTDEIFKDGGRITSLNQDTYPIQCTITIGDNTCKIKIDNDGYGNTEEYGDGVASTPTDPSNPDPTDPPPSGPIAGTKYDTDKSITVDGKPVKIPAKFTVSGVPEESTIENGLVIYLIPDGTTVDWTNATAVETAQKTYDQFVWVPVENAVLDLSGNSEALSTEANIKSAVQSEINEGRYPMAIKKDAENYFGVLYQFSLNNTNNTVKVEPYSLRTPLCETNTYRREPSTVTTYDTSSYLAQVNGILNTSYNDSTSFGTALQKQYNEMVNKVINNRGFWVGRYETSNMTNSNSATQKIATIKGTTTGINNVTWYRMYAQQRNYIKLSNTQSQLTSSMIWGSQWDQIMIWMRNVKNENKNSYYVINSLTKGNFGTSDDADPSTSAPAKTGNSENYKVKNIYDLAGNVCDWSLEASGNGNRAMRGCGYTDTDTSGTRADYRSSIYPYDSYTDVGSRASLY